ncbi:MAG TPA: universal stress protein [Thermoleophilia bacterium]|nr:universal stress protein [Thermoleophilia bacterium]
MFETLMVATDGSYAAEKAVEYAVAFAKDRDSRLIICTVTSERMVRLQSSEPNPPDVDISLQDAGDRISTEALARAEKVAQAAGVNYELDEIYGKNVAAAIAKEAVAVGADHIVIGSTGQTQLATCVLGSVAQNVVHYAHCPVTVVR